MIKVDMIEIIKNKKLMYSVWIIVLILISLSVIYTGYLTILALFLLMIIPFFVSLRDIYVILFGILPFANIFKISTTSMSLFTIYEIFYIIIFLLRKRSIDKKFVIGNILLGIYIMLFSTRDFNLLTAIKIFVGFYLIYLSKYLTNKDIKNIAYMGSSSIIIMLFLSINNKYSKYIIPYLKDSNFYIDSNGNITNIMRNSGFIGDPNYCSVMIIMFLSLLCVLYYYKEIRIEFWFFFFILGLLGLSTYSKSYFLCMIILTIFILIFILIPHRKIISGINLLVISIIILFIIKPEGIQLVLERFLSKGDLTTGRNILNRIYLDYILDNIKVLMIGEGIYIERISNSINNVHNIYLEILFKMGILGTLIYINTLFVSLKNIKYIGKRHCVNYIPLVFLILMFYFLAGILNYALPFYIIISYVSYNYQRNIKKN